MNEFNPAEKPKRLIISAVILLIVFPILNYLVMSFVYEYIAGDIVYLTGSIILYYATEAFSFALTYICFGMVIASVIKYGVKGCRFVVAAGYIALLLPYLSGMLIKLILTTDFRDYVWYYLAYTVLNYILLDGVILTVVILFTVLFKKKMKKRNPLFTAFFLNAAILFAVGLTKEVITTVQFIYELIYEYYSPITFNELVSLITSYLMLIAKAAAGYVIMRLTAQYAVK